MKTLFVDQATRLAELRHTSSPELSEGWARVAVTATTLHECRWSHESAVAPGGEVVGRIVEVAGSRLGHRPGRQVVTILRHAAGSDEIVAPIALLALIPDELPATTAVLAAGSGIRASLTLAHAESLGARSIVVFTPTAPAGFLLPGLARTSGLHTVAATRPDAPHEELLHAGYTTVVPDELDDNDWAAVAATLPQPVVVVEFGRPCADLPSPRLDPIAILRLAPINPATEAVAATPPIVIVDQAGVARHDFATIQRHFHRVAAAIDAGTATTPITVVPLDAAPGYFPDVLTRHPPGAIIVTPT